jgi:hypothetical protein
MQKSRNHVQATKVCSNINQKELYHICSCAQAHFVSCVFEIGDEVFVFDLDGTIVVRGKHIDTSAEEIEGSMKEMDITEGGAFEMRAVYFMFGLRKYPVYFRAGTYALLSHIGQDPHMHVCTTRDAYKIF